MHEIVGSRDILLVTFDTLRYDVAQQAFEQSRIPNIGKWLPTAGWERRHTPASFTYAAHHAFFSGFLPTPIGVQNPPRLFATEFPGSETTVPETVIFPQANIVTGLAEQGYVTHCIGGVGFFNKLTELGRVLPAFFQFSYWSPELGVTSHDSADRQVAIAVDILNRRRSSGNDQRLFIFINLSALHQPNHFYLKGAQTDSPQSQLAALEYVDRALRPLLDAMRSEGNGFAIFCSDHGTAYGEDGMTGHRFNHPVIGDVPYADFLID